MEHSGLGELRSWREVGVWVGFNAELLGAAFGTSNAFKYVQCGQWLAIREQN
jgi:hypothetical protein